MKVGDKVVLARHGACFDEMIDCKGEVVAINGEDVTVRFTTLKLTNGEITKGSVDYTYSMNRLDVITNG